MMFSLRVITRHCAALLLYAREMMFIGVKYIIISYYNVNENIIQVKKNHNVFKDISHYDLNDSCTKYY